MNAPYKLRCLGYVEYNHEIWLSNLYFNALMKIDTESGKLQIIDKFPHYEVWREWLYATVCRVHDRLFFIPFESEEIVSYDMKTGKFTSYALDLRRIGNKGHYYISAYVHKEYLYMFPIGAKCIVRLDTRQNSVRYLEIRQNKRLDAEKMEYFGEQYAVVEGKIYIPFLELNAVAIFDLDKEYLDIKYLNINGGCSTINYESGYFYMASLKKGEIYRWNEKTGEIKVYNQFPQGFVGGEFVFSCAYVMNKKVFFLPLQSNMIISFDIKSEKIYMERKMLEFNGEEWKVFSIHNSLDKIYTVIAEKEYPCQLDCEAKELKVIPFFQYNNQHNKEVISRYLLKNMYSDYKTESKNELNNYIEIMLYNDMLKKDKRKFNFGKTIFNEVREK